MIPLARSVSIGLGNRDGEIRIGEGEDGRCYLIATHCGKK